MDIGFDLVEEQNSQYSVREEIINNTLYICNGDEIQSSAVDIQRGLSLF